MKQPVFSFEAEILTDAPFAHIAGRLEALAAPSELRCLAPLRSWLPLAIGPEQLTLAWERRVAGAVEQGCLVIRPDVRGSHLLLEGRMKGWAGFLLFGLLRWRTDRLLDRLVEEL